MALPHVRSGEPADVRPFGAALPQQVTHALFKSTDLEVFRLVLMQGKEMPLHKVPGEITVQCLEGLIDVVVDGDSQPLQPGQLLFLAGNVVHAVKARQDSSALVTIVLKTVA